jgi:hypothetical protein
MRYYKAKRVIRDFTQYVNPNIKVKFNRQGENACDMKRKVIYLDLQEIVKNPDHKVGMTYHFKNQVGLVAFTLLHELGHIQTAHKVKNLDSALDTYSVYVDKLTNSDMVYKNIAKSYSRLTLEKLANEWAYYFAKDEYDKVLKLKYDLLQLGLN